MTWWEQGLRLLLAVTIGCVIGIERERKNRPAGMRTHVLVCVGASIIAIMESLMISDTISLNMNTANTGIGISYGRITAQVISGIGFLGAGTIFVSQKKIAGLTTAASLWTAACLGLAVGMGYYLIAIAGCAIVMLTLSLLQRMVRVNAVKHVEVKFIHRVETIAFINDYFQSVGVKVLDMLDGEEAGIKSVSFLVEGPMAYGYLKGERGVHRLVRISPFNSAGKRMTSFASVEVMPEFNEDIQIEIKPEDIEIDTHRASGAGGQHINKTDSAVRITHIPTGIVTSCQSERSQLQNKEQALNMLKSKLYQRYIEEQEEKLSKIKGVQMKNEWGSQIRSYVFCPYTLVKDVRTGYEETNVTRVMDGEIDEFIYAYLKSQI